MAFWAPVVDGTVQQNTNSNTIETEKVASGNGLDKEAFLKLLVAQMQYQDPLEPTSNTEYISQFATFSELEAMQNVGSVVTQQMGADLVGKEVILKTTSKTTGETTTFSGIVDYVTIESGKTYLSVGDEIYSIDDLESIVDQSYKDLVTLVTAFEGLVERLPNTRLLTLDNEKDVTNARTVYDSMTARQKAYVDKDVLKTLAEKEERMAELKKLAGGQA